MPGAEERIAAEFGTVAMTVADEDMPDLPTLNLVETPLTLPGWAEGLPLQSEEQVCARYSKSKTTLMGVQRS